MRETMVTQPKPKKPLATLAKDLKKIRKRPLAKADIESANRIFEEIDREKNSSLKSERENP
jgi:hypothetical protein